MKLLLTLLICCFSYVHGQSPAEKLGDTLESYRNYRSLDRLVKSLSKEGNQIGLVRRLVDDQVQLSKGNKRTDWPSLSVPIVFNVLYTNDEDRIREDIIIEQLKILNEDFAASSIPDSTRQRLKSDFAIEPVDAKINFCQPKFLLASKNGWIRYQVVEKVTAEGLDQIEAGKLGLRPLHPRQVVNIWVVPHSIDLAGFASFPGAQSGLDGIVIDAKFLGVGKHNYPQFNRGKTLTHLMGNYLGLSPIWGGDEPCADDGITDTPLHNGPNNGKPGKFHYSSCPGHPLEMTMNFMDNGDDEQLSMFTPGQVLRMRATLEANGSRNGLVNLLSECANDLGPATVLSPYLPPPLLTTGASVSPEMLSLELAPNPTRSSFNVNVRGAIGTVVDLAIYSPDGRLVYQQRKLFGPSTHTVPDLSWPAGVYTVQVVSTDGKFFYVSKLSVQ